MIGWQRRWVPGALALVLIAACGGGGGDADESAAGTRLLTAATTAGRRADAVSFELQARGAGRAAEAAARRGEDSLVEAEYDEGGLLEVRRVAGVVYVRTNLRIAGGPLTGPWFRIEPGADLGTWVDLLGVDRLAPTPEQVARTLRANVERVTGVDRTTTGRALDVVADPVADGARPSTIRLRRELPEFTGRSERLVAGGRVVAQRTYRRVRWGERARAIAAPDGAIPIEGAFDPQAASLASTLLREPTDLPAGWTRRATVAVTPAQGSGTCQEVATIYAAPAPTPVASGYLAAYLEPSGCAPVRQAGSANFVAGPHRGWVGTDPATGATIGALTVEGTAVRFRTSLAPAAAAVALAGWRPIPSG